MRDKPLCCGCCQHHRSEHECRPDEDDAETEYIFEIPAHALRRGFVPVQSHLEGGKIGEMLVAFGGEQANGLATRTTSATVGDIELDASDVPITAEVEVLPDERALGLSSRGLGFGLHVASLSCLL